jgi:hypothetical protein
METIFLVNPISGRGHLDSYARLYSRALVELGHRVVLVAETDGDTTAYLARNAPALMPLFSFVSFEKARWPKPQATITYEPAPRSQMPLFKRAQLVWQEEGIQGISVRCVSVPNRVLLKAIPTIPLRNRVLRLERALGRRLLRTRIARALDLPRQFDVGRLMFTPLIDHIEAAASMPQTPSPDLVVFLYLDLMAEHERNTAPLDRGGARPWIGIRFHPRLAKDSKAAVEGYFNSKNARGGIFLVPSAIGRYAEATPHLHFALTPDVADLELPGAPSPLAIELRRRAGSRTIVLQIGSITAHKGIPTLLDVIASADPDRFFFALIGEVHWEAFGDDRVRVKSFYARAPENVYLSQGYIASERDYNSVIAASDIVYAVYRGFDSSSNSLTKAAGLNRRILVSDSSLMGERVRRFKIGAVAPEGDAKGILSQLVWLSQQPDDSFGFKEFTDEQSLEALKRTLAAALPAWLAGTPQPLP